MSAKELSGIIQISLIGSLTTDKIKPKDADLLCIIEDNLDLQDLARISRRLQGKACSISSGADIFLANIQCEYIGRVCIWKTCKSGIRMRCDALNCGKREFLHDDLPALNLPKKLVENPPLIIYPSIVRNIKVPLDVEEILLNGII